MFDNSICNGWMALQTQTLIGIYVLLNGFKLGEREFRCHNGKDKREISNYTDFTLWEQNFWPMNIKTKLQLHLIN